MNLDVDIAAPAVFLTYLTWFDGVLTGVSTLMPTHLLLNRSLLAGNHRNRLGAFEAANQV